MTLANVRDVALIVLASIFGYHTITDHLRMRKFQKKNEKK